MKNKQEAPSRKGRKGSQVSGHDDDSCEEDGDGIHAKSGRYLRYISEFFFGFSAKF